MYPIRAVLIDDEELSIASLSWQLKEFCPNVEVVNTFTSPTKAYEFLADKQDITLCFLDIDMPEMSGFDFLELWQGTPPFDVIFTTAYNEFAIQAFKVSAVDYLLKPIDEEELITTIKKYSQNNHWNAKMHLLYQQLQLPQSPPYSARISVSTREGIHLIETKHILYLEAFKNYTSIFIEGKPTIVVSKTLKDIEQLLAPSVFLRVHQSYIVNWQKVITYQRGQGGTLILVNGQEIPVSKNKKSMVIAKMQQ